MKRIQDPSMFAALLAASLLAQTPSQASPPTRPTLVITSPTAKLSATNAAITVTGTTKDKVAVTNVWYQLNGAAWTMAVTTNAWTNWTAGVTLMPGPNTLKAYALDKDGNPSLTNTLMFNYVLSAPLTVHVTPAGFGTVTPDYNGKSLAIGTKYSMTAKADKGFAFVNWSGSLSTNMTKLTFLMASNLSFTANFKDATPPVLVVLSPKVHAKVTDAALTVTGKASDNVGVTQVLYQLNGAGWTLASTTNGWTNWMAQVTLSPGANLVQAFAEDAAGHPSKTNSVSFVYETSAAGDLAPASLSGLSAQVTSTNNTTGFTISFGAKTYSQSMLPGANEGDNAVGNYTYRKQSANTAQLSVTSTAPPGNTGNTVVGLTFTHANEAVYSITSHGGGSTGAVQFSPAQNLVPTSLAGDTADLLSSTGEHSTTVFANASLTITNQTTGTFSIGTYTFKPYSPAGGLLTIHFSSPSSLKDVVGYGILTFSASKAGNWFETFVAPAGSETQFGTFTEP
ncbi:MAG: hypothetical protein ABSH34_09840 [Verrucomicrobiota bacterium]